MEQGESPNNQDFSVEGVIDLSDREFKQIADLVYAKFGINLTDKKKALVRGRLNKIIKSLGFSTFQQYFDHVVEDRSGQSLLSMVDKISTNHSYFFREPDHFEYLLSTTLPALENRYGAALPKELKIWCAGCATGEEPYTLGMLLLEYFGKSSLSAGHTILATDISLSALRQAIEGVYAEERVKTIPEKYLKKYCIKKKDEWAISDGVKNLILFKRLNLMDADYPFRGKFDMIFCRNVMIYFDTETKNALVSRFHRYMQPWSYLFIGHSETLGRGSAHFKYMKPAVYTKIESGGIG